MLNYDMYKIMNWDRSFTVNKYYTIRKIKKAKNN